RPSSVRSSFLPMRWKSRTPSSVSRPAMLWLTAERVRLRSPAAFVTPPAVATSWKIRSLFRSTLFDFTRHNRVQRFTLLINQYPRRFPSSMATPAAPPDSFRQPSADGLAFATALEDVGRVSSEIAAHIRQELADQRTNLNLSASENFAPPPRDGELESRPGGGGRARSPVLRRLRQRRRDRAPCGRACEAPLRSGS